MVDKKDIKIDLYLIPFGFAVMVISVIFAIVFFNIDDQNLFDIPLVLAVIGAAILVYGIISVESKKNRLILLEIKELLIEKKKEK